MHFMKPRICLGLLLIYHGKNTKNKQNGASYSRHAVFSIREYSQLFPFAQLLIPFITELGKLLGLGEQFLGFLWEGLQQ